MKSCLQRKTLGLKNVFWALLALLVILIVAIIPAVVIHSRSSSTVSIKWKDIATSRGDTIPDFSFCGYGASAKDLPSSNLADADAHVDPGDGDMTKRIQQALNSTAERGGGVVALAAGSFSVSAGLIIPSGVVLRGAGVNQTYLTLQKLKDDPAVTLGNTTLKNNTAYPKQTVDIVDNFVSIGASTITVANADGLQAGQSVFVQREVTAGWVRASGMDGLQRNGEDQTWLKVGTVVWQPRQIANISGTDIKLSMPLTDRLDAAYMEARLVAYDPPETASEMGIQDLTLTMSPTCSGVDITHTTCNGPALYFPAWTVDAWAQNLHLTGFNNFATVAYNSSRITLANVTMNRDVPAQTNSSALPADIILYGSQVLVADCAQTGDPAARSFAVVTESLTPGPNAVLRHRTPTLADGETGDDETRRQMHMTFPHQRWAHGFLVEDTDTATLLSNRATNGSGQGWAITGGVGWNLGGYSLVQSPPLGVNWCIGCSGTVDSRGNGSNVGSGKRVKPPSLFAAQLADRL